MIISLVVKNVKFKVCSFRVLNFYNLSLLIGDK